VANSTVYGGVAGEAMAAWLKREGALREPDRAVIEAAKQRDAPVKASSRTLPLTALTPLREKLYDSMWHKVGIIRDAAGLEAALVELTALDDELSSFALGDADRAFNLSWHDWLNLRSLAEVSRVIAQAALARQDSRGAHFREDFPESSPLEASAYSSARLRGGRLAIEMKPVAFSLVRPGETLLRRGAAGKV
jgi:fumarate reductase flavoprotein subunit